MSRPIADILRDAREAHTRYRDALPHMGSTGAGGVVRVRGDVGAAAAALAEAFTLRVEAEHTDVAGDAEAWVDDHVTHPHYALLAFYVDQTARIPVDEAQAVAAVPVAMSAKALPMAIAVAVGVSGLAIPGSVGAF